MIKLKRSALLLAICLTALLFVGCSDDAATIVEESEAEAIYWHENNRYTAAIVNGDEVAMHRIPFHPADWRDSVRVVLDVTDNNKPWYRCEWLHNGFSGNHGGKCEIHLRDIDSLRTADWNHGKHGTGTTTRIDDK